LSTDGQLEASYSRYKGCTYACEGCQAFHLSEADRQALGEQLQGGAKRLQLTCPFPEVVEKVREATAKKGDPKEPKVALLEIETVAEKQASTTHRQHVADLLGLPQDEVPPLRIKWCHLSQDAEGELIGSCPKMPSDLEAKIGVHIDTKHPDQIEKVFGYLRLTTTDLNPELGLELPLGSSTYPGNTTEGTQFVAHRSKLAVPVRPGQTHLGDSGNDATANYEWLHDHGAIAVFAYNRRNEHVDKTSLWSMRPPCGIAATTKTARPMPRVAVCVTPMATTTRRRAGSMSVAYHVHPRNNSTVHTAMASWATVTA